jgi:hypothetical protein
VAPQAPRVVYREVETAAQYAPLPEENEVGYRGPRKTGRVITKPADPPVRVQMQSVPFRKNVVGKDGRTRQRTEYYTVPVLKRGR